MTSRAGGGGASGETQQPPSHVLTAIPHDHTIRPHLGEEDTDGRRRNRRDSYGTRSA